MNAIHDAGGGESALDRLTRVDLNLLVAFEALARELSVTRAAQRLGVTQSAMSHSLRRLRELLDDPVLVRGRAGMVLTPRAGSLAVPLRGGLVTLGRALASPDPFQPATARRSFTLATPDLWDVLALPPLLERLGQDAPGVDLAVAPFSGSQGLADELEAGEVDLAVVAQVADGPAVPDIPTPGLVRRRLLRDSFSCLIRAGHPALRRGRTLTLETYASLSHALIAPGGEGKGLVDQVLEQHGLRRRIALRLPHFYTAPAVIAHSDLVLTAPTALTWLRGDLPLVALPPPLPLPEHDVNLLWHQRFTDDPAHRWLRDLVAEVSAGIGPPAPHQRRPRRNQRKKPETASKGGARAKPA
jgi:DNA-binding transcriptional LysR family regulator